MAGGVSSVVLSVFFGMFAMQAWTLDIIDVNMAGPGCSNSKEQVVSGSEAYRLYANSSENQPFYAGCNVTVRASQNNQYLHYTVRQFSVSSDCGLSLWVYENPEQNGNTPSRMLTCRDSRTLPVQGSSAQRKLKFTVLRNMAQNSIFQLQIQVTSSKSRGYVEIKNEAYYAASLTDSGSSADSSNNPTPTNNEGEGGGSLNIGVVIGLAIAGVILIVALIGIAIYCCLKNRNQELKDVEAYEGRSGTSVFTSGTSQVLFAGGSNQRKSGGGGKYGSMEDIRSSSTDRANNLYSNKGYHADGDEDRYERESSSRNERGYKNTAFVDEADRAVERGGHLSRKDSGRGVKYDKKKNFSRHEEYEMSKVSKEPNGILKKRSKSPNRSQSSTEGSTVDSNALVYGYSQTAHSHPNTQHIPVLERTRSRSRSRGASSHRSGSAGRSRSGSVGKSSGKDMAKAPKSARQYNDMSHFLDKPKERPRSRSGSVGRRSRSDSKTSENHTPSEVSFAQSGTSSKKNTGGRRVHIQGVETDF